jgi:thiopeptide-type bacteriocin biosynthesis protein
MRQNNNPNDSTKSELQRTFIIGDQWLYYKFYSGPKTADILLTRMVKPLANQMVAAGDIDKWFFIRYADPKIHIRVRFHVKNSQALLKVIEAVNTLSKPFIEQDLIWKIQVDSYQREIERYGVRSMELAETLFFHDSKMIVDMLDMIEGDEGERIRWLFGLRAVDSLLDDFLYAMDEKYELVTLLRENFGGEFGMNRALKEQLEGKFRKDRAVINELLDRSKDQENPMLPLFELITRKSHSLRPIAEEILKLYNNKEPNPFFLNDLIGSYSHMMINRLFKSKQRLHELVLYDFLHRYYKSEIARRKYSDINVQKKKQKKKKD